jgi:tRNA(Ile)-lysidine synthase
MLAERGQPRGPALVRPLLDVPRVVVETYARRHGLAWIDDESNDDRHFRRNFLRHEVMPHVEQKFPGAGASLARAAGHFAEAATLLDDLAAIDCDSVTAASGRMALHAFNRLSLARARNLLRYAWRAAGFRAPDTRWIDEALKQLATADSLSEIQLATAEGELHVYRGELYVIPLRAAPPPASLQWLGEDVLPWVDGRVRFVEVIGQGIQRDALLGKPAQLRPRQGGERLQPDPRRPRRTLRNLLQENAVPPWERERLPLLWVDGRLAWIGGIGCDAAFACPAGEAGILPVWERSEGG